MGRKSKADAFIENWIARQPRKPPSGVFLVLKNPGYKLVGYLGLPIRSRRISNDWMVGEECTFDLPEDWELVYPPQPSPYNDGVVVARQKGTDRIVRVIRPDDPVNSLSEVLN